MAEQAALAAQPPARWRELLLPGFLALLLVLLLTGLGVWQLHRLAWKEGILATIRAAESRPGIPLAGHPGPYSKVVVRGRLRTDLAALYGDQVQDTAAGPEQGGQLIVPLERAGEAPILVDLGWVPLSERHPASLPKGLAEINGYMRPAEHPGLFSAPDDVAGRRFYTLDPGRIGAALGLPQVAPFTLVVLGERRAGIYPMPAEHLPHPPNNHFQYALTWFGLALVLILEFGIWSHQRLNR